MKGVFFIILACALWALDSLIRYPLLGSGLAPIKIVFYEHLVLFIIFFPTLLNFTKSFWKAQVSHIVYFVIIGCIGSALATIAFTKAFTLINPSLVILLQKLQPLVAITLAHYVLNETIHRKFLFWASVCLLGGFLISYQDLISGISSVQWNSDYFFHSSAIQGYLLTTFAIIGWGAATVFGKKLSVSGYKQSHIMCGRFTFGFLLLLPLFVSSGLSFKMPIDSYLKILIMVFISGLAAMYLYYKGLAKIPARVCAIAETFFPLFAVVVNWIFLGKSLMPMQIAGGVLLVLGSIVIQSKHY